MGNIRVIGPRSSGKTTYLAALAHYPEFREREGKAKNFDIQALNEETDDLARQAVDIMMEGASLEPTVVNDGGIDELPFYSFRISPRGKFKKYDPINLAVRDYPGEIFHELTSEVPSPLHAEFIEECFTGDVDGCLIFLTAWEPRADRFYNQVLRRFLDLMEYHDRSNTLRLAVTMSKCERGEIWPGRLDPELDLFKIHLPQTHQLLKAKLSPDNLRFFALSTFGVLHRTDPRPNRTDVWGTKGTNSILRETGSWQPYGLIAPLYWLSSGKRMREDA